MEVKPRPRTWSEQGGSPLLKESLDLGLQRLPFGVFCWDGSRTKDRIGRRSARELEGERRVEEVPDAERSASGEKLGRVGEVGEEQVPVRRAWR